MSDNDFQRQDGEQNGDINDSVQELDHYFDNQVNISKQNLLSQNQTFQSNIQPDQSRPFRGQFEIQKILARHNDARQNENIRSQTKNNQLAGQQDSQNDTSTILAGSIKNYTGTQHASYETGNEVLNNELHISSRKVDRWLQMPQMKKQLSCLQQGHGTRKSSKSDEDGLHEYSSGCSNIISLSNGVKFMSQMRETQQHDSDKFNKVDEETSVTGPKTFTMSEAFERVGGFGQFQMLALIIHYMIRSFGLFHMQGFALTVLPQQYTCQYLDHKGYQIDRVCSPEEICETLNGELNLGTSFNYQVDKTARNYLNNWYVAMDVKCEEVTVYNKIGSFYFLGFSIGILLFQLPDLIGRRKTMICLMLPYVAATLVVVFSHKVFDKSVGMFIQGALHVKIMLSYTHMFELVPDNYKSMCSIFITFFDTMTLVITGLTFKYITQDAVSFYQVVCLIQCFFTLLYFLFIPESPRWLLTNGQYSKGIEVLNYIAYMNGSSNRISQQAEFDLIGQLVKHNIQIKDNKQEGTLQVYETMSMISLAAQVQFENREGTITVITTSRRNALSHSDEDDESSYQENQEGNQSLFRQICCDPAVTSVFIKSLIMFTVGLNLLFLSLYQVRQMKGDKFSTAIIIGVAGASGNLLSGVTAIWVADYKIYCYSLFIVLLCTIARSQISNLAQAELLEIGLFFLQMYCIGHCINLQMIIFANRIKPQLIATCSSVCFCVGSLIASTTPIIATKSAEIQQTFVYSLCIIGISIVATFADDNQVKVDVAKSIITAIEKSQAHKSNASQYTLSRGPYLQSAQRETQVKYLSDTEQVRFKGANWKQKSPKKKRMIQDNTNKLRLDNVLAADWYLQKHILYNKNLDQYNEDFYSSDSFKIDDSSYRQSNQSSYEHSLV